MADQPNPPLGSIAWADITVPDADQLRVFYEQVAGWKSEPVDMGGYADYVMATADGKHTAGVCHRRGPNTGLPGQWMIYIVVDDLDAASNKCVELGGKIIELRKDSKGGGLCVIQDPTGAACALFKQV